MSNILDWLDTELESLLKNNLLTPIKVIESPISGKVLINGLSYLNFSSNNYLGLANNQRLKDAAQKAVDKYGVGPAAVRSITGTTLLHEELETRLADFKKCEAVVTFQSGFVANLATIPALVGKEDVIFSDELNHASIIDGCRLSGAEVVRYKHLDTADLSSKLAGYKKNHKKLIVTDGVFSMDGDIAPLDELSAIAQSSGSMLMVDDAHGEGVLGAQGRGIVDYFGLHNKVDVEVGTMSKAFGVVGGLVAGKRNVVEWIKRKGRPFLFSSAMTFADVAACLEAVNIMESDKDLFDKLWSNTKYFKKELTNLGFDIGKSQTPITPIMIGDEKLAQEFSKILFENGLFGVPIVYPTVAKGNARIRLIITASHTQKDLSDALEILEKVGKDLKMIE